MLDGFASANLDWWWSYRFIPVFNCFFTYCLIVTVSCWMIFFFGICGFHHVLFEIEFHVVYSNITNWLIVIWRNCSLSGFLKKLTEVLSRTRRSSSTTNISVSSGLILIWTSVWCLPLLLKSMFDVLKVTWWCFHDFESIWWCLHLGVMFKGQSSFRKIIIDVLT